MTGGPAVTLGFDVGTSALKGVLLDGEANVVGAARSAYPTARPLPGRAEQRPRDWIRSLERVCSALARIVPPERWKSIGLAGMIPSLVIVDQRGDPLGPALTWEDGRAEEQAAALRRRVGARALYATTGQWVDGRYLAPMWRWVADHEPERAHRAATVLGAKDFLLQWFTGEFATDPSTATGFGCYDLATGRWDKRIAALTGIGPPDGPELPAVVASTRTFPIRRDAAERLGLPRSVRIAVGAADSVLSAEAVVGPATDGIVYIAGTSTAVMSFHDHMEPDARHRYLVTPSSTPGRWGYEMDLLSTGSAMRWCAALLGLGPRAESRLLRLAEVGSAEDDLVFLPYVSPGEQGALWDPNLTGALVGLTLRTGPAEVARALVDGIVLESRRCVSVLRSKGAGQVIRATGGIARSRWFRQLLADATGCDVAVQGMAPSVAAVGAAALVEPNVRELLVAQAAKPTAVTHPDRSTASDWDRRWRRHEEARTDFAASRRRSTANQVT